MEGKQLFRAEPFLAIKQIAVSYAQAKVDDGRNQMSLEQHQGADPQEEDHFYQPEEEVDTWQLAEDVLTCEDQEENVKGDYQLAPEIKCMRFFAPKMTDGMGKDEDSRGKMEPGAATFEPFEDRGNDGKGYGVHGSSLF
jgi:hypothetical protein